MVLITRLVPCIFCMYVKRLDFSRKEEEEERETEQSTYPRL